MKTCGKCRMEKPLTEFHRHSKRGHQSSCKSCSLEQGRDKRLKLQELKENPCTDCGGSFPHYVMEFDHRDPSQKEFTIGGNISKSWKAILGEISKCDLVCANCHRIRTFSRREEANGTLQRDSTQG